MSLSLYLIGKLNEAGLLKKDDVLREIAEIGQAKMAKAGLHQSVEEAGASQLLMDSLTRLNERLK